MKKLILAGALIVAMLGIGLVPTETETVAAQGPTLSPRVIQLERKGDSGPLTHLTAFPAPTHPGALRNNLQDPEMHQANGLPFDADGALQASTMLMANMPAPLGGWDGINFSGSGCSCLPPDTNGDVGPNHYIQIVNGAFQIWDKSGNSLMGSVAINTLFSGFGGVCEKTNDGDPIVLYDRLANRWLFSQFANVFQDFPGQGFWQCLAVSTGSNPLGSYNRYGFKWPNNFINDYPKFGVWPDGYYMTANQFSSNGSWQGTGAVVFDRAAMLAGNAASAIYFDLPNSDMGGMLPSHFTGTTAPPANEPNYFVEVQDNKWNPSQIPHDRLQVWALHADFATPTNSTFKRIANVNVKNFNSVICGTLEKRDCIVQRGTRRRVDAISDRTLYRLNYRNFGSYAALVTDHTVNVATSQAGVRWYEIHITNGVPSVYQQGSFAPDSLNRWMGSAAMDKQGDIAVGYSTSGSNIYPALRYAGRLAGDPLGALTQGEAVLKKGRGSQTHPSSRWGDYSALAIDPSDDCTFWYTNEYYAAVTSFNWQTWIGKFKFPGCS